MRDGKRIVVLRRATVAAVFVAVLASLAFDIGLGRPSAFGIGEFFLLCPLGGFEAMIASTTFLPAAAISMAVVLLFALLFGRAWCAWGCPVPPIRTFFRRNPKGADPESGSRQESSTLISQASGCTSCRPQKTSVADSVKMVAASIAHDSRTWVLVGVLAVTFVIGLPVFCLVCPIGLTFGSVSSLWHLIVDKQVTASVIVFPIALAIEIVVYRKWCANLCPIAALLGAFGHAAKLFRPRVDANDCLLYNSDKKCNVCTRVCAENINMHAATGALDLSECTRCGECVKQCPTNAISIGAAPSDPVVRKAGEAPKRQDVFLPEDRAVEEL